MNATADRLRDDHRSFAERGLPHPLEAYVLQTYGLDLSSAYGSIPVKNAFGKASGQLSLAVHQVERDARAGLGFCVLKTVVAQDEAGGRSMHAWAIPETRMVVERIRGTRVDEEGWTVTWKGRGWSDSFDAYLTFMTEAVRIGDAARMLVVPSCTFHLPADAGAPWREAEYQFTIGALLDAWNAAGRTDAMPLEKDFSPTLAGSDLAAQRATIIEWIERVPALMRRAAGGRPLHIGMKIFNAMFDDEFQAALLLRAARPRSGADFVVYGNRLFDPDKEFEGKRGVAYGGPDLSARNLAVLDRMRELSGADRASLLPFSATGNIDSGARAVAYLQQGCTTFQIHTYFQLPDDQYAMTRGSKVERALHELLFHPEHGFIAGVLTLRALHGFPDDWNVGRIGEFFRRGL